MLSRGILWLWVGFLTLAVSASPAEAQDVLGVERGKFDINIGGGAILHPNSSALKSVSPVLTFKGRIFATEHIGFGFAVDYARTETDDDIFPLVEFQFDQSDSTTFVALKQPVALFHTRFEVTLGTPVAGGRIYPYLSGGVGAYHIYLDPQQQEGAIRNSDLMLSLGGSIKFGLTSSSGFEIGIQDLIYTSYDRDEFGTLPNRTCRVSGINQFNGTVCPNERFPFLDPERSDPNFSEPQSTIHNIMITASFSFIPGI